MKGWMISLLVLGAVGCSDTTERAGGSSSSGTRDTGAADGSAAEDAVEDTTIADTATEDTAVDTDGSGSGDATADTAADTEPSDTALDTEPGDTTADTEPGDTTADTSDGSGSSSSDPFVSGPLLGRPAATSIAVHLMPDAPVEVRIVATDGAASRREVATTLDAAPSAIDLSELLANTRYDYTLFWRTPGASDWQTAVTSTFQTARAPGQPFVFTVQADSHLDENSDVARYRVALENIRLDAPDFHMDLGDTFMSEKHSEPFTAVVARAPDLLTVQTRYAFERDNFAALGPSVPLFLVTGNHEGEMGYLREPDLDDLPTWADASRRAYFADPAADGFYSGTSGTPGSGNFYAYEWGDALFVVLDPFTFTNGRPNRDPWLWTLGETQWAFLQERLASSTARYKFIFIHNLVGGAMNAMRGGAEASVLYEWGGQELDGTDGFATHRPGWRSPIHDLFVETGVTAVFHGHDHFYAQQERDGIIYQTVPQPAAVNTRNGAQLATEYGYLTGTFLSSAGHMRVTVTPAQVTAEYVRAWLPTEERAGQTNREIAASWTVPAP